MIDNIDKAILFGGAKGGGKSFLLCLWVFHWTKELINLLKIDKVKYPVALGFMGRKRGVDFNDTTLETFKRIIPPESYEIRTQDKEIVIENKAKVLYGGLDDEQNINKFNSAEFAFIAIDQAEETIREDVGVLKATLRLKYNGIKPPYKEFYTANPAECWLKEDFIKHKRIDGVYIPALPDDNPYLPVEYKDRLRESFSYDPNILKAYLEGDWDAFLTRENYLISYKSVDEARLKRIEEEDAIKIIASDVATKHGDNFTVILYRQGHSIREIELYQNIDAPTIALKIQHKYEYTESNSIVIDSDGFGEGVADIIKDKNLGVLEFHGGYASKAIDNLRFRNLRSQFYWIVMKKFEKGLYSLNELPQHIFEKLKSQLCNIKIRPPDGQDRFQIETKEDMLARGVQSPDLADAFIYSEYAYFQGKLGDIRPYQSKISLGAIC